jgi:hypothetical protein
MNQSAIIPIPQAAPGESFTSRQWATMLGINPRSFRLRQITASEQRLVNSTLTRIYAFAGLPQDYRATLEIKRRDCRCLSYAGLLDQITRNAGVWAPPREFGTYPSATQAKALKVKQVMATYFGWLDVPEVSEQDANTKARAKWLELFGEPCSRRTIYRWANRIDERGGAQYAPNAAYCDDKSTPHHNQRLENRRHKRIPHKLIAEFRCLCVKEGIANVAARIPRAAAGLVCRPPRSRH